MAAPERTVICRTPVGRAWLPAALSSSWSHVFIFRRLPLDLSEGACSASMAWARPALQRARQGCVRDGAPADRPVSARNNKIRCSKQKLTCFPRRLANFYVSGRREGLCVPIEGPDRRCSWDRRRLAGFWMYRGGLRAEVYRLGSRSAMLLGPPASRRLFLNGEC